MSPLNEEDYEIVSVEPTDPPGLVTVGVGDRGAAGAFSVRPIPGHLAVPIAETGKRSGFGFGGRRGGRNEKTIHFRKTGSGHFDEQGVRRELVCFGHDSGLNE